MLAVTTLRDAVVHRAAWTNHPSVVARLGELGDLISFVRLDDFFGDDYIVATDYQGGVTVVRYDHIDIDEHGAFCPVERIWGELTAAFYEDDDEDDDG